MFGTFDNSTMSSTPWCDAPSSPVMPARSRQNTTGCAVQSDVEVDLIEGPGQEGRVHREHRAQAAHRHAGGGGDGVLLGDADVDAPIGVALRERQQAGAVGHGGGEGDHVGAGLGLFDQRLGERRRVAVGLGRAHVVESLDHVVLGRCVAAALLGEDVDDGGAVELGGVAEGPLELVDVVAVEGAVVADTEILEERGGVPHLAHRGLGGLDGAFDGLAERAACP